MRALVCSGGGAKGSFQVGVLKALFEHGAKFDYAFGVSTGALSAAGAAQEDGASCQVLLDAYNSIKSGRSIYRKYWFGLPSLRSFYDNSPLRELIEETIDVEKLRRSSCKLAVGAVDLITGDYIDATPDMEDFEKWLLASAAIPVAFAPVRIGEACYVDGGVRHIAPLRSAILAGADEIDVIVCSPRRMEVKEGPFHIIAVAIRALDILTNQIVRADVRHARQINAAVRAGKAGRTKRDVQIRLWEPGAPVCDTLEFDPDTLKKGIASGYQLVMERMGSARSVAVGSAPPKPQPEPPQKPEPPDPVAPPKEPTPQDEETARMDEPEGEAQAVVEMSQSEERQGWLGRLFGRKPKVPPPIKGTERCLVGRSPEGALEVRRLLEADESEETKVGAGEVFVRVVVAPQPLGTSFAAVVAEGGHDWDLLLSGAWQVENTEAFLTSYALEVVSPGSSLGKQVVESWITNSVRHRVRDAVKGQSVEALREKDALPSAWWETQFNKWLGESGLAVKITDTGWESASFERAQAEQRRLDDLQRIEEQQERERQARVREVEAQARYEQEKQRVEQNVRISEQERQHQLQMLEYQYRKDHLAAETAIEEARRQREAAALEHEVQMANLRNDLEGAQTAKERQEEADRQRQEVVEHLEATTKVIEKLSSLPDLLQQLASRDQREAHQAAERLTSPEFGVKPEHLATLGYAVTPQGLVEHLHGKSTTEGEPVALRKAELRTRDIGTAKVKALPINTSLQFQVTTRRAGYVTLLNIGTSGAVYVHVPNAYVGSAEARVAAGRTYSVPGAELLPPQRLAQCGLEYVEVGPAGWEHVAVLVSNEPLVGPDLLASVSSTSPFHKLTGEELGVFCARLAGLDPAAWSAGILSFLVG